MKFERVSFEQYMNDCIAMGRGAVTGEEMRREWEAIKLPTRATSGSAGYDFFMPYETAVSCEPVCIPTGIRCQIDQGYVLMCCPKSGIGCKHHMALENTVGIIDAR